MENSEKSDNIILEILKIPKVLKFLEALKIMMITKKLNVPGEQEESNPFPDHAATRLVKTPPDLSKKQVA